MSRREGKTGNRERSAERLQRWAAEARARAELAQVGVELDQVQPPAPAPTKRIGSPKLLPHERRNPRTYVQGYDLVDELGRPGRGLPPGFFKQHKAELWQLRRRFASKQLPPSAIAYAVLLLSIRGLRSTGLGCALQAPLEKTAELLGCSKRMAGYAIAALVKAGWARRHQRNAKVTWTEKRKLQSGKVVDVEHLEAEVHSVTYLTRFGAVALERAGATRQLLKQKGHQPRRFLVQAGVVGSALRALSRKLRELARRVTDAVNELPPLLRSSASATTSNRLWSEPVGSRPDFGTGPPERVGPSTLHRLAGAARRAGLLVEGVELERLYRLWCAQQLTIGTAWPDLVRNSTAKRRHWLITELGKFARVFSREALLAGRAESPPPQSPS